MTSRLLVDFGVRRETPGQVQHHRMVQIYENQLFEVNVIKSSKWDGEKTLTRRGWAKFTNFIGDRLVPRSEYAEATTLLKKTMVAKLTPAAALEAASKLVEATESPPEHRKSAIVIAEEVAERKRVAPEAEDQGGAEADEAGEAKDDEVKDDEDVEEKAEYGDNTSEVDSDEEESEIQFWNPACPEGYEWVTAWKINRIFLATAEGGWVYGNNMQHVINMEKKFMSRTTDSGSFARRRVWYRIMAKINVDPIIPRPFVLPLRMTCFFDVSESKESTFLMNAYENQRWSPILMSWGNKFPGHLLFHDPAPITNRNGKQKIRHWSDLDALPPGFRWASQWTVDERPGITGEEGYLYAPDFPNFNDNNRRGVQLVNSATANVRRRRWVRRMVPIREHVRKTVELDPMPIPALFPKSGLLRPLQGKEVRRGLHHVDVILVHGLSGSSVDTFKGPIRLSQSDTFWPSEYLLSDDKFTSVYGVSAASTSPITHSVRTLVVEHGLFLDVLDPMWTMDNAVKMLAEALKSALVGCRPIVWIGHSIGGLLIKELLYNSFKSDNNALFALTRGIVFLATPHHGASSINTILDMRIAKNSTTTDYLKPRMHFHEMQAWFDATDIEYVNIVEDKDIPSRHFSGVFATVLMKFVGLRIVQVNDGMLTMGAQPTEDLNTPIRCNHLAAIDHWSLGEMKLGNAEYDKVYGLIRLSVARWLRAKNEDSRTAWNDFSASVSAELFLLTRFLYEIMRTNSPISRTLMLLEHKTNPDVILSLMKTLTVGSPRQARLERLAAITDLDADNLDRLEDYLRERPSMDTYVGKYRVDIESRLCVLTESISDLQDREEKRELLLENTTTRLVALLCTEDLENVKNIVTDKSVCIERVSDMLFWIELSRSCKDMLSPKGADHIRDSVYSHEEIEVCIEKVHQLLMDAISHVNEAMRASVERDLNRPSAVVKANILPEYAPPPLPPSGSSPEVPPTVPPPIPHFSIGENDDDLEVVVVTAPPPIPVAPPSETSGAADIAPQSVSNASEQELGTPLVSQSPIQIDDEENEPLYSAETTNDDLDVISAPLPPVPLDDDDDLDVIANVPTITKNEKSEPVQSVEDVDDDLEIVSTPPPPVPVAAPDVDADADLDIIEDEKSEPVQSVEDVDDDLEIVNTPPPPVPVAAPDVDADADLDIIEDEKSEPVQSVEDVDDDLEIVNTPPPQVPVAAPDVDADADLDIIEDEKSEPVQSVEDVDDDLEIVNTPPPPVPVAAPDDIIEDEKDERTPNNVLKNATGSQKKKKKRR